MNTEKRWSASDIVNWITHEVERRGWSDFVTIYGDHAKEKGEWLYLPVEVDVEDLYERATRLQELEDAWNNLEPYRFPRLMIVPPRRFGITATMKSGAAEETAHE